jgi:putative ABC transport system ATP-binding protein
MPDAAVCPPLPSSPCLQVQALHKRYGTTPIWAGVSLTVQAGECVAVLGESGVGKSTLLNCLAGLDTPDGGTVAVAGRAWAAMNDTEASAWRRTQLGFVFQAFHVLPHLSVAQNVGLPLLLLGRPDAAAVEAALAAVGLGGMGERMPQTLSGGQLQRVAIARALIHRPRLILADEPTGNLDPGTAEQVMSVLQAQATAHAAALVWVTHSPVVAGRADRRLRLTPHGMDTVP